MLNSGIKLDKKLSEIRGTLKIKLRRLNWGSDKIYMDIKNDQK